MPCSPYSPPPRYPGSCPGRGWPPYRWMPTLPETFRQEVSYEGQIHWLANAINDCWLWTSYSTNLYILQGAGSITDAQIDALEWGDAYQGHVPDDSPVPEYARCGDYIGLVVPCTDDGTDCMLLLEVTGIDECRRFFDSTFLYAVRDLSDRMESAEEDIDDLQERMTVVEGDVANLKERVTKAETNITDLQNRVTKNEGDITNISNTLSDAHGVWRSSTDTAETTAQIEAHQVVTVSEDGVRKGDMLLYRIPNSDFGGSQSLWVGFAATDASGGSAQFSRFATIHDNASFALQVRRDLTALQGTVSGLQTQVTSLQSTVAANLATCKKWIQAIVGKVAMGGTVNDDGTISWESTSPILIGNINIYSTESAPGANSNGIYSRSPASVIDNDLWFE